MKKSKEIQLRPTNRKDMTDVLQVGALRAVTTMREEGIMKGRAGREIVIDIVLIVDLRALQDAEIGTTSLEEAGKTRKCIHTFRRSPAMSRTTMFSGMVFNGSTSRITCRLNLLTTNRILICSRRTVKQDSSSSKAPRTQARSRTSKRG